MTPLKKLRPPSGPLVFSSYRCRSRASSRAFFALAFEVALRVTAPSVMRNGSSVKGGRLYLLVVPSSHEDLPHHKIVPPDVVGRIIR
jgi:hypothetical protein